MKNARSINIRQIKSSVGNIPYNIVMQIAGGVFGFLLSLTSIYGNYTPFGIGFVAAVPTGYTYISAFGSILGYLASQQGVVSIRYISAVILAVIIKNSLSALKQINSKSWFCPATALICNGVTAVVYGFSRGITPVIGLMYLTESVVAGASAYFFQNAADIVIKRTPFNRITQRELFGLTVCACLIVSSVSNLELFSISLARVVMSYFIMTASCYAGISSGAVVGIVAGVTAGVSGNVPYLIGGYAFGGLLAGVFSKSGRFGSAASFAVANGIILMMEGGSTVGIGTFIEVAVATIIFVAMPSALSRRIEGVVEDYKSSPDDTQLRNSVVSRLKFASKALNEVSDSVEEVSKRLAKLCANDMSEVYRKVQETSCSKCGLKKYCWETAHEDTVSVFSNIGYTMKKHHHLNKEDMPEYFVNRCIKINELTDGFNRCYSDYMLREAAESRITQVRSIVADQFEGIAQLLESLSDEFGAAEKEDRVLDAKLTDVAKAFDISPKEVRCTTDGFSRMKIQIRADEIEGKLDEESLTHAINDTCGRKFGPPTIVTAGDESLISFFQCASFESETVVSQLACNDAPFCGDAYNVFSDGKGRSIMIISDGMGTGGRAAVDGAMASSLLSKLVSAGFGFDSALRVVNSALLVKSGDESLATLDIACLDLFSGEVEFLKAGAPASFICHNGRAEKIEESTLPAGILREVEFGRHNSSLNADDIILLVSDGVVENGSEWIIKKLEEWHGDDLNVLAKSIADEAKRLNAETHEDDITVMVTKLSA